MGFLRCSPSGISSIHLSRGVYIGFERTDSTSDFHWLDGSTMFDHSYEPRATYYSFGHCGQIAMIDNVIQWMSNLCTLTAHRLCEMAGSCEFISVQHLKCCPLHVHYKLCWLSVDSGSETTVTSEGQTTIITTTQFDTTTEVATTIAETTIRTTVPSTLQITTTKATTTTELMTTSEMLTTSTEVTTETSTSKTHGHRASTGPISPHFSTLDGSTPLTTSLETTIDPVSTSYDINCTTHDATLLSTIQASTDNMVSTSLPSETDSLDDAGFTLPSINKSEIISNSTGGWAYLQFIFSLLSDVLCPFIPLPPSTMRDSEHRYAGLYVTYTCIVGYSFSDGTTRRTLICFSNGKWNSKTPYCMSKLPSCSSMCLLPRPLTFSNKRYSKHYKGLIIHTASLLHCHLIILIFLCMPCFNCPQKLFLHCVSSSWALSLLKAWYHWSLDVPIVVME